MGLILFVAALVAGCGSANEQPAKEGGQGSSGERGEVGGTEALVWGEGGYGVVMAYGATYDAASWEEQAQEISEEGIVALAPEDTAPGNLLSTIGYLKEERGVGGVALLGGSAGGSAVLRAAQEGARF